MPGTHVELTSGPAERDRLVQRIVIPFHGSSLGIGIMTLLYTFSLLC